MCSLIEQINSIGTFKNKNTLKRPYILPLCYTFKKKLLRTHGFILKSNFKKLFLKDREFYLFVLNVACSVQSSSY